MVKLVRLTSEDNCNFTANLDSGIALGVTTKIGLLNLTFNSEFDVITIDESNNEVQCSLNTQVRAPPNLPVYNTLTAKLVNKNYTQSDLGDLHKDLEGALNSCLQVNSGLDPKDTFGQVYASFRVRKTNEKVQIEFKYTPVIMFYHMNSSELPNREGVQEFMRISQNITEDDELVVSPGGSNVPADMLVSGSLTSAVTDHTSTLNKYTASSNLNNKWSQGSAIYMARVGNLVDHVGDADQHGFGIGLTFSDLSAIKDGEEIPTSYRDFEMIVQKTDEPYQFIDPRNPHTPQLLSAVQVPYNFDATTDQVLHDNMVLERKGGIISGQVWLAGNSKLPAFQYKLPNADRHRPLYPYLYIKAGSANCTAGRPVITMDGLTFKDNEEMVGTGQYQGIGSSPMTNNAFEVLDITGGFGLIIPSLLNTLFENVENGQNPTKYTIETGINGDILRILGFSPSLYSGNSIYTFDHPETLVSNKLPEYFGFVLTPIGLPLLVNSDNFIVILDSNPLFSYDASRTNYGRNVFNDPKIANRGRRLNILATIPKNDNSGFLEYEPNEVIYIDLDLSKPEVLKTLNLRVLNKNFDPLQTNGLSIMTLLISD